MAHIKIQLEAARAAAWGCLSLRNPITFIKISRLVASHWRHLRQDHQISRCCGPVGTGSGVHHAALIKTHEQLLHPVQQGVKKPLVAIMMAETDKRLSKSSCQHGM